MQSGDCTSPAGPTLCGSKVSWVILRRSKLLPKYGAVEAFLAEHHGLARATPGEVKVGRLVASAGQFAVLHVGRGRHVLHEYPPGQVPELDRGQQRGGQSR